MKRERKNGIAAETRAAEGSEIRAAALAAGTKAVQEIPAAEIRAAEMSVSEVKVIQEIPAMEGCATAVSAQKVSDSPAAPASEIRAAEAERWSVAELERLAGDPAIKVPAGLESDLERTVEALAAAEMLDGAIRTYRSRRDGISSGLFQGQGDEQGTMDGTHSGISRRKGVENGAGDGASSGVFHGPSHRQGIKQGIGDGTHFGISRRKGLENGTGDGERRFRLRRIRWAVGGIAAGLLLVAGLSLTIASRSEPEDTFSDPKLACAEVEKVMHLISERLTPVRESVDLAGELFKKQIDKLK